MSASGSSGRYPRVADFSTHFSGPVAGRHLVQLGADVVRIEHPTRGDGNRSTPPFFHGEGLFHSYLGEGVRSVAAHPKAAGWPQLVDAVAHWADVIIVGNRPLNAIRMGIDLRSIIALNSNIVYCQITGYGLAGPWAHVSAHGLNMDALAGLVNVDLEDGRPVPSSHYRSVGTTLAGIEAALGIFAALYYRNRDGGGQYVHVSIWESALSWQWRDALCDSNLGKPFGSYRDFGTRYSMYWTADHKAIIVAPIERRFWTNFCDVLGLSSTTRSRGDWRGGIDYGEGYDALGERDEIQAAMLEKTRAEWTAGFAEARIPAAPVLDLREAIRSEHADASGVMTELEYLGDTYRIPTTPVSTSPVSRLDSFHTEDLAKAHRAKGDTLSAPPTIGQHTSELLEEMGVPDLAHQLTTVEEK